MSTQPLTLLELLTELDRRGIGISRNGEKLHFYRKAGRAKGRLTESLIVCTRRYRGALFDMVDAGKPISDESLEQQKSRAYDWLRPVIDNH